MTEEIKLGVYERLLNDYESDKEKYAADLAYAACCLGDTVTSEEIARNESTVTFEVGLPLALSSVYEEIWKSYLAKPIKDSDRLKEFLEGISRWYRQNYIGDMDDSVKVDYDSLVESSKSLGDDWYSKFFEWIWFCEMDAVFEDDDIEKCKHDAEKWEKAILPLWSGAKPNRLKLLLCFEALFKGNSSLNLEKPSKRSAYPWYLSYSLAKGIVEDSIKSFASEENQNPFALYMLGISIDGTDLGALYYEQILKLCVNGKLSEAVIHLVNLIDEDEQEYHQEAYKWCEKGAKMGNPFAQSIIANMYEDGSGIQQDLSASKEWHLRALSGLEQLGNKGNLAHMTLVANYYANGAEGIPVNTSEALKWYKRALSIADKHKDAESQQKILIKIYEIYSRNQEWKDIKKLESEAQSGDVAAMQAIGDLYLKGDTVPQNINEACKWYKTTAEHLNMPFFVLAIDGYEEYMEGSDYCKIDEAFKLVVEKALELDITHTDEFFACYRYMPCFFSNNADESKIAKNIIERIHNCFYKYDAEFANKVKEIICDSSNGHWGNWMNGLGKEWPNIKKYLKKLLGVILNESPEDLTKFIRERNGKLKGFGIAKFSELCVLLQPRFYLVLNSDSYLTEIVKDNKELRIRDNNYINYPFLCKKIINNLESLGFSNTYLGHLLDRFFYEKAEDEYLSKSLVDNFQTLVSHLVGIIENRHATIKEVKTQNDSDIEIQDLDSIFHELLDQARGKFEGKQSESILLDSLKHCLVSKGRKWHDEYERRFQLWLKQNLPQNPNTKI